MATTWAAQVWFGFGCVTVAVGYWCLRQAEKLLDRAIELNRDTREAQDEMTERHRLLMGLFLTVQRRAGPVLETRLELLGERAEVLLQQEQMVRERGLEVVGG